MASAPGHKFGQIIGDTLESALLQVLQNIADEFGLYLDYKHSRSARNGRKKVKWKDHHENEHDLDYVLELGGSDLTIGKPRAFIEIAWRRYTKHSRNKVQEIQGAITPLAETYSDDHPFLGVVLAGVFTQASITQLQSHGFSVLYFPYDTIIKAFSKVNINAEFDESTSDKEIRNKIAAYEKLSKRRLQTITRGLLKLCENEINTFLSKLRTTLMRSISKILIIPLHGSVIELSTITNAVHFLENFKEKCQTKPFVRFEIFINYTNGDEIRGSFKDKVSAIDFLNSII